MCAELLYGLQEVELFLVQAHLLLRVQVIHRGFSISSSVTSPELSSRGTNNWLGLHYPMEKLESVKMD